MYFNQYKRSTLLLTLLMACSQNVFANETSGGVQSPTSLAQFFSQNTTSWVITLSGGPAWVSGGEQQTFYLAPEIEKTYTADQPENTVADGDLFLGIQKPLYKKLIGQLGLDFGAASSADLSGDIWDDADPTFDNHSYDYQVSHTAIALKGKLLLDMNLPVIPWISASAGVGFNHAYNFTNAPTIPEALPNPDFSDNTTTAFTYTLAVGVQRFLTKNWQAGISYEFSDWGDSELGKARGQTMGDGLSSSNLYSNAVLLNITYVT
ncbi:MAG: porin family protein [Gammaproteobacteria bacterium]|nr:porin family protein [Gammaproteobacteria bacterium]